MELIGNGKTYKVPAYQRDYSWTEEQWEDLWNDILEMYDSSNSQHYMGALVIEAVNDRVFQIIDGQQRMATLSVFALAVIKQLAALVEQGIASQENRERILGLRQRFIGEKNPASLIESSKLYLNETDDGLYQDYLVQLRNPINPKGLVKSNKLLWECHQYFVRQLLKRSDFVNNGEKLAYLLNETVARQLLFIVITVNDELNAYTVFETLNARGLELSSTDLLKNYLFSRVTVGTDLQTLQRRWRTLLATVRQERFPEFLRYHLACEHRQVRRQRLFKMVRDTVRTAEHAFNLMERLEQRAEFFSALSDPYHEYWTDNPKCRESIRELNLFGVRQMTPLLFVAWETFDSDNFVRLLMLVRVIAFRYTIVSGLNPNELEPTYHSAAQAILTKKAKSTRDVFEYLQPIYVADDKFEQDFALLEVETKNRRKKIAKYILARLECDASNRACDYETDPGTLEHILPENPSSSWYETFAEEHWESAVYRLGNLTLLEPSINRKLGNTDYPDKLKAYAGSHYALTQQIPEFAPEEWSFELLQMRQRRLAQRAIHVWRADFA